MNLKDILENNIKKLIEEEKKPQFGTLSGSNALMFDGFIFEAESSENCPRVAMLRRVANVQKDREIKSFISNNHGRLFEDLLRRVLSVSVEFLEEEQVEVFIEDDKGNKLLTARPDKIVRHEGQVYPIEVKTIQSNSTAYQVFVKEKPKLGALVQLAIYMYGHQLKKGFLLYCASNWFQGFAGKTQWKVEPSFKIYEVTIGEDGFYYYNGNKSTVSTEKIIQGSYEYLRDIEKKYLSARPHWVDVNGDLATYSGCTYCDFKGVCDEVDTSYNVNLEEFFSKCKDLTNKKEV